MACAGGCVAASRPVPGGAVRTVAPEASSRLSPVPAGLKRAYTPVVAGPDSSAVMARIRLTVLNFATITRSAKVVEGEPSGALVTFAPKFARLSPTWVHA